MRRQLWRSSLCLVRPAEQAIIPGVSELLSAGARFLFEENTRARGCVVHLLADRLDGHWHRHRSNVGVAQDWGS
jgi:hypothetical protein